MIIQEIESKDGAILRIEYDEYAESPREWDNITKLICFHNKYNLGDKHDYRQSDYENWEELKEAIMEQEEVFAIKPLFMYDHSGITISTTPFSSSWDSGQIGYAVITVDHFHELSNINKSNKEKMDKDLANIIDIEVNEYDSYLRGECYAFSLLDKEHNVIDSCGGFIGEEHLIDSLQDHVPEEYQHLIKEVN